MISICLVIAIIGYYSSANAEEEACITCHRNISPGQVADWEISRHFEEEITCSVCHGEEHTSADDVNRVF
jgi:uncharacterized CHY-type Zn-finger protein